MDYAEYVSGISFRWIQPRAKRPKWYYTPAKILKKIGIHLDMMNTRLPDDEKAMKKRLRGVCKIPKMSTFAMGAVISRGVEQMPEDHAYVNVGVWNGFTLLAGMAGHGQKKCVGIDNFSGHGSPREAFLKRFERFKGPIHSFHEMGYEDYFARIHNGPIGFYLYDGYHGYEDQLKGLQVAEPFFSENCIIMVDDVNWKSPRKGTYDFIKQSPHHYRVLLDETTYHNGHPTWWNGLLIFQRVG